MGVSGGGGGGDLRGAYMGRMGSGERDWANFGHLMIEESGFSVSL